MSKHQLAYVDETGKRNVRRFAFTTARLAELKPPRKGRAIYYDTRLPGFAVRMTDNGAATYFIRYKHNGKAKRFTIGPVDGIKLDDARKIAAEKKTEVASGVDIQAEKIAHRNASTFGAAFDTFIKVHKSKTAKDWRKDQERYDKHLKGWANRPLKDITPDDVLALRNKVEKAASGATANRVLALISATYNKITGKTYNPARAVERFAEKPRQRFLSKSEVAALIAACDIHASDASDIIKLAIFTGARRGNIFTMKWCDVHIADATWRIPETKAGQVLTVPLSAQAVAVLKARKKHHDAAKGKDDAFVFASSSKAGRVVTVAGTWATITKAAGIPGARFHDLRRTFASFMAMSGAPLPVVQKALGHLTPVTTAKVYAVVDRDSVRSATEAAMKVMMETPVKEGGK